MVVSPMKQDGVQGPRGMREMIQSIDNDRDLFTFITGYSSNIPPKPADIVYEKNSVSYWNQPNCAFLLTF